jgi:hypothetical protein
MRWTLRGLVGILGLVPFKPGSRRYIARPVEVALDGPNLDQLALASRSPPARLAEMRPEPVEWTLTHTDVCAVCGLCLDVTGAVCACAAGAAAVAAAPTNTDVEKFDRCGGALRIIACIEDPRVIEKILRHLGLSGALSGESLARAPPAKAGLFD